MICTQARRKARTYLNLVLGMMLRVEFQNRSTTKITAGAVKSVGKKKNSMGQKAKCNAMVS